MADANLREIRQQVAEALSARTPKPFAPFAIAKTGGVGQDTIAEAEFDKEDEFLAKFVINTPDVDRDGMIISPLGVKTDNYQRNPLILWDHGFCQEIPFPVGTPLNPDGSLSLQFSEDAIRSNCKFHKDYAPSRQLSYLVRDRFVNAASIHVLPLSKTFLAGAGQYDEIVQVDTSDMLEWSLGLIPVNPMATRDTIASLLGSGKIHGEPIHESIACTLKPHAARKTGHVRGATPGSAKTMTTEELKAMSPEDLQKTIDSADTDEETKAAAKTIQEEQKTVDDGKPVETEETTDENKPADESSTESKTEETDPDAGLKPGAKFVKAMHVQLKTLVDTATKAMEGVENPDVLAMMGEELEGISASLTRLEGGFGSIYPDLPALGAALDEGSEQGEEKTEDVDEEAVKTWLASATSNRYGIMGIGSRLDTIASSNGLTAAERKTLSQASGQLSKILTAAKTAKPSKADDSRLERLETKFEALVEKVSAMVPAAV